MHENLGLDSSCPYKATIVEQRRGRLGLSLVIGANAPGNLFKKVPRD